MSIIVAGLVGVSVGFGTSICVDKIVERRKERKEQKANGVFDTEMAGILNGFEQVAFDHEAAQALRSRPIGILSDAMAEIRHEDYLRRTGRTGLDGRFSTGRAA